MNLRSALAASVLGLAVSTPVLASDQFIDLSSGQAKAITDTRDDESPGFAPNSKQLIYATRLQGREVLMTSTLDGRIKAKLTTQVSDVREPVWGPYLTQRR